MIVRTTRVMEALYTYLISMYMWNTYFRFDKGKPRDKIMAKSQDVDIHGTSSNKSLYYIRI